MMAIAVTLLVLDIRIPDGSKDFVADLQGLLEKILFYFLTFLVLAGYWVMHRRLMHDIKRVDRSFIWLTLLFIAFVALFPATMSLLGSFGNHYEAVLIYILTISACGFSMAFLWIYAAWKHRLIDERIDQEQINFRALNILINPTYFTLSLLLLFFIPDPTSLFFSWIFLGIPVTLVRRAYRYRIRRRVQRDAQVSQELLDWLEELERPARFSPFAALVDLVLFPIRRFRRFAQSGRNSSQAEQPAVSPLERFPAATETSVVESESSQEA